MAINKEDIKKLREQTGCGIADCRIALEEAAGDYDKAIEILKVRGLAKAVKKADRDVTEGRVFVINQNNTATMIKLECETDFVSNSEDFRNFGKEMATKCHAKKLSSAEQADKELDDLKNQGVLKFNENIKLSKIIRMEGDDTHPIVSYIQMGKDGALVKFSAEKPLPTEKEIAELLEDIVITGLFHKPEYLRFEDVPKDAIEREKEVIEKMVKEDASLASKPANVLAGIITGKVRKTFADRNFLDLPFYKDEGKKVATILEEIGRKTGSKIGIQEFVFCKVGA